MAHIHIQLLPNIPEHPTADRGTQTDVETRPSLPTESASAEARRHTSGNHPLAAAYRTSTDTVTGTTTPQALQFVHEDTYTQNPNRAGMRDVGIQTPHSDSVRTQSYENVKALFKGVDNQTSVGLEQDIALSREIALAGEMDSPKGARASDCICLPPDLMAYRVPTSDGQYKLRYNCPEINGTGFGGIRDIHPEQLQEVMRTYGRAGEEIAADAKAKGEAPLIIVANSGREGASRTDGAYQPGSNSKMIWEKMYVADVLAQSVATPDRDVFASSLDSHVTAYYAEIDAIAGNGTLTPTDRKAAMELAYQNATARMAQHKDEPLVLLGYSRDMASCCKIEDGRPMLFGRPVHGAVNDRGLQNLALTEQKDLSFLKFSPMNASIKEGVDKFEAAKSRAAFLDSDDFKKLTGIAASRGFTFDPMGVEQVRHFQRGAAEPADLTGKTELEKFELRSTYFRGVSAEEALEGVQAAWDDFEKVGLKPLFKPNGTGQSKGIIAPKTNESKEAFMERFKQNIVEIEGLFGKGAGYPFMVMPLLKLDETDKNEAYDLRFATYQNVDNRESAKIRSVPLILKKEPPKAQPGSSTDLEFSPTNVTAAVAKTGQKGTDFIVSLCSEEGMRQSHLSKDNLKSMSLYFAAHEAWMLKTEYPRPQPVSENPLPQQFPENPSTSSFGSSDNDLPRAPYSQLGISLPADHLNTNLTTGL